MSGSGRWLYIKSWHDYARIAIWRALDLSCNWHIYNDTFCSFSRKYEWINTLIWLVLRLWRGGRIWRHPNRTTRQMTNPMYRQNCCEQAAVCLFVVCHPVIHTCPPARHLCWTFSIFIYRVARLFLSIWSNNKNTRNIHKSNSLHQRKGKMLESASSLKEIGKVTIGLHTIDFVPMKLSASFIFFFLGS